MKERSHSEYDVFYKAIGEKRSAQILEMIRSGILEELENEEIIRIFRLLMQLRNPSVIDLLAKKSRYFPIEMLDAEIKSRNDRDFVSYVLSKHIKKFHYKEPAVASRLFEAACSAECKKALRFLLGKGLAEDQYPRLISGSEELLSIVKEIRIAGLHPDTIVTFFVEAAIAGRGAERIRKLMELGFDIKARNAEGLTAPEVLERGISRYDYGTGTGAEEEKKKDEEGLKILRQIFSEETGEKKR